MPSAQRDKLFHELNERVSKGILAEPVKHDPKNPAPKNAADTIDKKMKDVHINQSILKK